MAESGEGSGPRQEPAEGQGAVESPVSAGGQALTEDRKAGGTRRRGPIRRFWSHWWGKLTIIAIIIIVLAGASMAVASQFTESNKFCGTACHEMLPYNATWQASKHRNVNCVTCHIGPGIGNFIVAKTSALREVWVHLTGQVKAPIAVTRNIPNSICQGSGCHPGQQKDLVLYSQTKTTFKHSSQGHSSKKCIDCHSQVVHTNIPGRADIPPQSMTACFKCHKDGATNCSYCHTAPHQSRGECSGCHSMGSFAGGKNFTHPQPLVGAHATLQCQQCHVNGPGTFPTGCVKCHGDHHNGLPDCAKCHLITHFLPANFTHPQEGPHIPAGEEPLQCSQCHTNGFGSASCPCHGGKPPTGGD
jgi:nitrate/TMAO reductase-like tetraheme cytochrome c subunit